MPKTKSPVKKKSLKKKLFVIMAMVLLMIGIAFTIAIVVITSRARKDYEIRESETLLNGICSSIEANVENYKDLSRLVMLNKEVVNFLRAKSIDSGIINDTRYGVMDVLNVCSDVDSVFIFRNDDNYVNTGRGVYFVDRERMNEEIWQSTILNEKGGAIIKMNSDNAIFRSNRANVMTIERAIYDIYTQKLSGILLMNISMGMLEQVVPTQYESEVCILDEAGNYLVGNEELADYFSNKYRSTQIVHTELANQTSNEMISGIMLRNTPLIIMCRTRADIGFIPVETTIVLVLLLVVFSISIVLFGALINKNITKPVIKLSSEMEKRQESGWLERVDVNSPNIELEMLVDSYNRMIDYQNDLFTRLIDNEKSVRTAEMRVLHEQIKPHFLYNSMETISYMALEAGAENVHDALETLGSFYRNFLSKGDREIPLSREISITKDYLSLQKLRYGDILQDEYNIDERANECMIPKLILQPLVENCIYHGIKLKGEPGKIIITTVLCDDNVIIKVKDTGVGMSQEMIDKIIGDDYDEKSENSLKKSFGLRGTIWRIRYYVNRNDVVKIKSEIGEYTEIEIKIPMPNDRKGQDDV